MMPTEQNGIAKLKQIFGKMTRISANPGINGKTSRIKFAQ
jgi:hypothetical protein